MIDRIRLLTFASLFIAMSAPWLQAQDVKLDTARGDAMIADYFREETQRLAGRPLAGIDSLDEWKEHRVVLRQQLFEMLGLDPLPKKTDLHATVTGRVEHDGFVVEKLHYQSRPGLYVTANLYLPKKIDKPAPTILYVCGHGRVVKDGVSYGNKSHYQHHGAWFARHGYVCLTIDTLQLGEIEGIHHGTYRHDRWWWNSRGYTPAGVEAWNCIRSLDYLEAREEVDAERIGVTGRSGGGAYSWWISSLDERIKVAVPVAGITDLTNHVYDGGLSSGGRSGGGSGGRSGGRLHDGVVEGHCDCMYMCNTYRWDYATVAALVAPRPLLISNTDKDPIFPLDGVVRLHHQVRRIYELYNASDKLGLHITEGPHKDTQELRVQAFAWFNRWLKDDRSLIERTATKQLEPEQLRVFATLPDDEKNTSIQETFTEKASEPVPPADAAQWQAMRDQWMIGLRDKVFRAWPGDAEADRLDVKPVQQAVHDGVRLTQYAFTSQGSIRLPLYVMHKDGLKDADLVVLNVLDDEGWLKFLAMARGGFGKPLHNEAQPAVDAQAWQSQRDMLHQHKWVMAYVPTRGVGPTAWNQNPRKQTQHRRRFMLLGQTLDGMRVWDARRAVQALRRIDHIKDTALWLQGERDAAGIAVYASLFEPDIRRLDLWQLPTSHRDGPIFLNVLRVLDTPQAVAMAAARTPVRVYDTADPGAWSFVSETAKALNWADKTFVLRNTKQTEP